MQAEKKGSWKIFLLLLLSLNWHSQYISTASSVIYQMSSSGVFLRLSWVSTSIFCNVLLFSVLLLYFTKLNPCTKMAYLWVGQLRVLCEQSICCAILIWEMGHLTWQSISLQINFSDLSMYRNFVFKNKVWEEVQ